jgi:hypothetical protein
VGGEAASCLSPANHNDGFNLLGAVLAKLKAYRGTGTVGHNSRFGIIQRFYTSKLDGDVHEFFASFEADRYAIRDQTSTLRPKGLLWTTMKLFSCFSPSSPMRATSTIFRSVLYVWITRWPKLL